METLFGGPIRGKRILDVGCGRRYPNVLLFTNVGNIVVGVDLEVVGPGFGKYRNIIGTNGLERGVKTFLREAIFDRMYHAQLEKLLGSHLDKGDLDLRVGNAESLCFKDDAFDIVISNAVLEHIRDVGRTVSEMKRVVKPGGFCYAGIHLFPSLSGGHSLDWVFPDIERPEHIPPWDHLRGNLFPVGVHLNRFREKDYRQVFEDQMKIVDWITERYEGEDLLTPEIKEELSGYTKEELLKREITVIAAK